MTTGKWRNNEKDRKYCLAPGTYGHFLKNVWLIGVCYTLYSTCKDHGMLHTGTAHLRPVPIFESCVFSDSSHTTSGCPFFEKVATRSGETRSYFYTLWFCLVCHVLKLLLYNGFHFSEIIFRRDILNTVSLCHEQNWNFLLIQ